MSVNRAVCSVWVERVGFSYRAFCYGLVPVLGVRGLNAVGLSLARRLHVVVGLRAGVGRIGDSPPGGEEGISSANRSLLGYEEGRTQTPRHFFNSYFTLCPPLSNSIVATAASRTIFFLLNLSKTRKLFVTQPMESL